MAGLYNMWIISTKLLAKMQEKGTSVATALAVLVFLKQKILFCYVSLSKRGKWKTDWEGHVFQEKWKRVHLFVLVKTFYVLKCRHLASFWCTLPSQPLKAGGVREKTDHGQLPEVHPQLRGEGAEKRRRKRNTQHGWYKEKQKKPVHWMPEEGEALSGRGGWGQRSQEVKGPSIERNWGQRETQVRWWQSIQNT